MKRRPDTWKKRKSYQQHEEECQTEYAHSLLTEDGLRHGNSSPTGTSCDIQNSWFRDGICSNLIWILFDLFI
jgi:hypothetical protein